ncbi:uncharacterized protein LOC115989813 [Quercus lobata]|uniref:uncharacterized protein LOC115989813 n=1 Tax=Quercus lobata TaxID=97700 RepID=UPI001249176E|nr:uncharacterized protein LOC115989813 [Quercus lobata]
MHGYLKLVLINTVCPHSLALLLAITERKPAQAGPAPASLDSDKPHLKSWKRKMMFVPFVAGMFFSRKRKAIEILPDSVKTLWNKWELRNTVATASLGVLSINQGESEGGFVDPNYVITVFWAPFLLLHLGGPDTITAYSLEDNELWLRHLLGLLVQVGGAIYVFLTVWKSTNALYLMAIPIFFAGIIKYGERTWVLMSASSEHFRDSMLPPPDPGPNYARFVEEYMSKEKEGFKVCSENNPEDGKEDDYSSPDAETNSRIPEAAVICKAYMFFEIFKRLPANLILSFHIIQKSQYIMQSISADEAFKVIEVELGFMYDMFYTKAVLLYSVAGRLLHFVPFICTVSLFVIFLKTEKHIYSGVDVAITYILLVGAIVLEIYAAVVLVCSDWTILWLSQHGNSGDILYRAISLIPWPRKKRWSNAMGHFNLVRYCLKDKPAMCTFKQRFLWISKLLEKYRYHKSVEVPLDLKAVIFDELQQKMEANRSDLRNLKKLCA